VYARQGRREHCAFAYDAAWLSNPARFGVSADLPLVAGYQAHKAASAHDSIFHGAIVDTAPDAWGRRVIARDHAKRRRTDPQLPALTALDYGWTISAAWAHCGWVARTAHGSAPWPRASAARRP